jgi:type I restriction enzyme S subunit
MVRYKYLFREKHAKKESTLQAGAISFGRVVFKDDEMLPPATKASYQEVRKGEYLINPINLNYDLKSLRTALSEIDVCVSPAYIVLRPLMDSDPGYLKYQLHLFDVCHMKTLGAGVRQTISFGDIGVCGTIVPPKEEQAAIASFLDRVVGEIDSTIASQERMIELLKERRSAIITQAVTKGLDPKAKMKDSGVPWLGRVPAHWLIIAPKRFIRAKAGGTLIKGVCANSEAPGLYPGFSAAGQDVWLEDYSHEGEGLVLSAVGARCGKTFKASGKWGVVANTHCLFAVAQIGLEYMWFLTNREDWWERGGSAQPFVKVSETLRRTTALPPLEEQIMIAKRLAEMVSQTDAAIDAQERMIELLKERRSAIITQAVTGQIDVR